MVVDHKDDNDWMDQTCELVVIKNIRQTWWSGDKGENILVQNVKSRGS